VEEMNSVTQRNAASAEESASASQQMNAQSKVMKDMVTELVAMVGAHDESGVKVPRMYGNKDGGKPGKKRAVDHAIQTAEAKPILKPVKTETLISMEEKDFTDF
jgi:methyl-accepting chemotaxis protein